ncbi:MAG: penicillin-binding protein 2 [Rhizobium sp.]|nr:penicillin-binding protein 2 [Rhizobium sp.]
MATISHIFRRRSRSHLHLEARGRPEASIVQGAASRRVRTGKRRLGLIMFSVAVTYLVIGGRLVQYGLAAPETTNSIHAIPPPAARPDIVDRNGELLATDLNTMSLYAEPIRIVDADEVVEKLATVIPDLDWGTTHRKLRSKSAFQWLKRQLTPRQQADILALGIPGIGFRPEKRRFYPGGPTASHILGHVNVDNRGLAGMERYIDRQGLADLMAAGMTGSTPLEPVRLSIDLRVQSIVRSVIVKAMHSYQAEAAGAVVLDAHTGEILAMASVPDYDPNEPSRTLSDGSIDKEYKKGWFNRMSNATFEMGSTIKSFTIAMGLDSGKIGLESIVDASRPIRMGGFTINDFHGRHRPLTVAEVFRYSSNIATVKIADMVGIEGHKEFLTRLGLLSRLETELPEIATPTQPRTWKRINSATISYGHGMATTPLQTAVAAAALVNGGKLIPPTFLAQSQELAPPTSVPVLQEKTSAHMRHLFDWNGKTGSGRSADVPGFHVGGKTGTADKVVNGRYATDLNFNAFLGSFPMHEPRYVVLSIIDAPLTGDSGHRLAAYTAAPMIKEIVGRAAPLLGVKPYFGSDPSALLIDY